jgi:DNA-binding CsgD family transcriptional regulator
LAKNLQVSMISPAVAPVEPEQQREALNALLCAKGGALMLWDRNLRAVWVSPEACAFLEASGPSDDLRLAAAHAWLELEPLPSSRRPPSQVCVLDFESAPGRRGVAEFSRVGALHGRAWLAAELRSHPPEHAKLQTLTPAELRVLRLLIRGLSNREMGAELFLSLETVKTHVSRILGKLGVSSRSKAVTVAAAAGFRQNEREPFGLR